MYQKKVLLAMTLLISISAYAREVDGNAVIGSMLGAAAGSAIGSASGGREGAIIGGGVGGALGAAVAGQSQTSASVMIGDGYRTQGSYPQKNRYRKGHGHHY